MRASFDDKINKVHVVIDGATSLVRDAKCECKASESRSCSHIIAVLLAIEDYTVLFGFEPPTCTSKLMEWNKGRKRGKNPKPVMDANYSTHSKKRLCRRRMESHHPATIPDKNPAIIASNNFVTQLMTLPYQPMFLSLIAIKYDDYVLDNASCELLGLKIQKMMASLCSDQPGPQSMVVTQNSDLWNNARRVRITASVAKQYFTAKEYKNKIQDHLWEKTDLSHIPAIKYGRDNEPVAFSQYKSHTGNDVRAAGFFTNKKYPGIGCSPDGLVYDLNGKMKKLLEIKCPMKIQNNSPINIADLKGEVCYTIYNGTIKLKPNHAYYYQVQCSLAVLELDECDFMVWSAHGFAIETIYRNEIVIQSLMKKLMDVHENILLVEFFEMRLPRNLPLFEITDSV